MHLTNRWTKLGIIKMPDMPGSPHRAPRTCPS